MATSYTQTVDLELHKVAALREELGELADDAELFQDMVEGETDAIKIANKLMAAIREQRAEAELNKGLSAVYAGRANDADRRREKLDAVLQKIAHELGGRIKTEIGHYYRTSRKSIVVEDESEIPPEFLRVETSVKKRDIADAIFKHGAFVPGVQVALSEGWTLK